jgi:hypothetical protein
MTAATRAFEAFRETIGAPSDQTWKYIRLWPGDIHHFPDYAYWMLMQFAPEPCRITLDIRADNREVALHAHGKSGLLLERHRFVLEALLLRRSVPGTFIHGRPWADGPFRIGYKLDKAAKALGDDAKMALILRCLVELATAADEFLTLYVDHPDQALVQKAWAP